MSSKVKIKIKDKKVVCIYCDKSFDQKKVKEYIVGADYIKCVCFDCDKILNQINLGAKINESKFC